MSYNIKQLGLGGILDQTIAIIKDHFGLLFRIMMLLMVPFYLIVGLMTLKIFPVATSIIPSPEQQAATEAAMAQYWPLFVIVSLFSILIVLPITNAAVIQAVAHVYLGKPITAVAAMKDGLRLLGPVIGTAILYYLAVIGGFALLFIPAIIFALWFSLSQHVVVIEGTSGPTALGRSRKLVRGHMGTLIALGIVMWLISALISILPNLIPQGTARVVVSTFAQVFTTIFWTATGVVLYFSCRCANENFDLHLLAENIAEPALADEAAVGPRTI